MNLLQILENYFRLIGLDKMKIDEANHLDLEAYGDDYKEGVFIGDAREFVICRSKDGFTAFHEYLSGGKDFSNPPDAESEMLEHSPDLNEVVQSVVNRAIQIRMDNAAEILVDPDDEGRCEHGMFTTGIGACPACGG